MTSRLNKEKADYNIYLRIDRLEQLWSKLKPASDPADFSLALFLGTGLYPNQQRALKKGNIIVSNIPAMASPTKYRYVKMLPELYPAMQDRLEWLDRCHSQYLLSKGFRIKKKEKLVTQAEVSFRLAEIAHEMNWGTDRILWRIRLTAMIRMVQDGWTQGEIITQLGKKWGDIEWVVNEKYNVLNNFWKETPEAERVTRLQDLGRRYVMEQNKYLTDLQLCQVYEKCLELEERAGWRKPCFFTRLLLGSGLRLSEAARLRVDDIMFQHEPPVIYVRNGKGMKSRHTQVTPEFSEHLRLYVKEMPDYVNAFLFPSVNWNRRIHVEPKACISLRTAYDWWMRVMREVNISANPHKARHTFATWEAERLPQHILKDTLGHSSIITTEKFYRHGIVGRNYTNEPPKWRDIARILPDIKEKKRFMTRCLMIQREEHNGQRTCGAKM